MPGVAEVVLVLETESFAVLGDNFANLRDRGIDALEVFKPVVEEFGIAVAFAVDLEPVQMRVRSFLEMNLIGSALCSALEVSDGFKA